MSDTDEPTIREGQRIAKVMARAGLCSRRDAEAWIAGGRVSVNGKLLDSPAYNVSDDDDVRVDGEPLKAAERTRLFLFHKPRGLVTTARDPEGRSTIFEALPPDLPRVVAVGRLDINTEGLLLLTNDGGLSRVFELPSTGWLRRYRVRAHGEVLQEQLDALREGVTIDDMHYAGIDARLERQQGANVWLMMGLREGKNREIKRVLEHLGLEVNRLIRVSFGPFELGDLGEGEVVEVRTRVLRDQLGPKLAKQAGVDLDSPLEEARPSELPAPSLVKAGAGDRRRDGPGSVRPGRDAPASRRPQEGGLKPRPGAKPFEGREDRSVVAAELAARGQRRETVAPAKRKHVTALRAEAQAEVTGPRKRIERSATADRKGREIKVERVMKARPEPDAAPAEPRRPLGSRPSSDGPRDARDFNYAPRSGPRGRSAGAAEEGRRPSRPRPPSEAPRESRSFALRGERSGGASAGDRRPSRPPADAPRETRSFAPRGERSGGSAEEGRRPSRPPADAPRETRSFAPRGERSGGSAEEGRRPSRPSTDGPREKRSFAPRGERAGGSSEGERRPSRPSTDGPRDKRSFAPRGERSGGSSAGDRRPSRPPSDSPREKRSFAPRGERSGGSTEESRRPFRTKPSSEGGRDNRAARPEGQGRRPAAAKEGERPKRSFSPRPPSREGRPPRPGGDKPRGGGAKRPPRKS